MKNYIKDLNECILDIEKASSILNKTERKVLNIIDNTKLENLDIPLEIEDKFHIATHETGSNLGFIISDLKLTLKKYEVRLNYPILSDEEFEKITKNEFSTSLIQEIKTSISLRTSIELLEASKLIKKVKKEFNILLLKG